MSNERSSALLAAVFERSSDAIILADDQARIVDVNPAATTLTGYRRDELLAMSLFDLVPFPQQSASREAWRQFLQAGHREAAMAIMTKARQQFDISYRAEANLLPGLHMAVGRDTRDAVARERSLRDEAVRARNLAEDAVRLRDEFLATVSHELRTPLNAIIGWAHLLRSDQISAEQRGKGVEVIDRNARLQARLVEELLDTSALITGQLRLTLAPVDVRELLADVCQTMRVATDAKQLTLTTKLEPALPPFAADERRLRQLLFNLVGNAVKFSLPGGAIEVAVAQAGPSLQFTVRDHGIGIAPELLPYVCDAFRRQDDDASRYSGLGLGLTIARHLTELHGGELRVTSDGPGLGTQVACSFPLPTVPAAESEPAAPSPEVPLAGLRLLLVEDDDDTRVLMATLFEQAGALVQSTASAEDALPLVDEWRPQLLVSDIGLPGMDGCQLMRAIRGRGEDQGGYLPALAVSAYTGRDEVQRMLFAGFQMHMPKPVDPAAVIRKVAQLAAWGAPAARHRSRRPE